MFYCLSTCTVGTDERSETKRQERIAHWVALGTDFTLGSAILVLGILAIQTTLLPNFVTSSLGNISLGAGSAYLLASLSIFALVLKKRYIPHEYCVPFLLSAGQKVVPPK